MIVASWDDTTSTTRERKKYCRAEHQDMPLQNSNSMTGMTRGYYLCLGLEDARQAGNDDGDVSEMVGSTRGRKLWTDMTEEGEGAVRNCKRLQVY